VARLLSANPPNETIFWSWYTIRCPVRSIRVRAIVKGPRARATCKGHRVRSHRVRASV
jgi:hypothetical protein